MDDKLLANYGGLLQFSEDDALLAAGVAGDVIVLSRQGEMLLRLAGRLERNHVPHVWCVAINRQAGLVAAGHRDGTVCVWSLASGGLLAQRRLASGIIGGIAFAGLRQRATRRFLRTPVLTSDAALVVTLGDQVALVRAPDLEVLGVMPAETTSSIMRLFVSVAAERSGEYVVGGRENGNVEVWRRAGDGYEQFAMVQCQQWLVRVLLDVEPTGPDEGVYLYAAARTSESPSGPTSEITSWKFSLDGTNTSVVKSLTYEVTDIALGGCRQIVLYSCRMRRPLFRHERPPKYGLVSSHEYSRATGSRAGYFERFADGVLSVAVTADLGVAYARDDTGRINRIRP